MWIKRAYRYFNLLSIDIVLGAIICAIFFARLLDAPLFPIPFVVLGLSVWIIYTGDHLLDAYRIKSQASTDRHLFHQENFKMISVILMALLTITAILLFYLRIQIFKAGLVLGALVVFYFLTHRYLKFLKEFLGAWLYTFGVLIISVTGAAETITTFQLVLFIQFFLIAFFNLLLFSWFDREHDKRDNHSSFVIYFGTGTTKIFLGFIFVLHIALVFLQCLNFGAHMACILLFFMNVALMLLFILHKYFADRDKYRLIGDAVFFLPLIYLLLY